MRASQETAPLACDAVLVSMDWLIVLKRRLVERPFPDVPEDAHAVVAHDGIGRDAVQAAGCNVICVDVADEGIGRVIGELLLEEVVIFLPDGRVGGLARLRQIFVDFFV